MKRLFLVTMVAVAMVAATTSCQKEKEPDYGLTSLKMVTGGGDSYAFAVDQTTLTASNQNDPVANTTQNVELASCTFTAAATLQAEVLYNGAALTDAVVFDMNANESFTLTVKQGKWQKIYTVTMVKGDVGGDLTKGIRVTADMTAGGLPSNLTFYDVNYFKGKFYAFTAGYQAAAEGAASEYFKLFTSTNGKKWTEVTTTPNSIGGVGAQSVVYNNKLYVMGGFRAFGVDENGLQPDYTTDWYGNLALKLGTYRIWSTADGVNFTDETENITYDEVSANLVKNGMFGQPFNQLVAANGKLYYKGGRGYSFFQLQVSNVSGVFSGNTYTRNATTEDINVFANCNDGAFYSFKNKLWIAGGFKNYLNEGNVSNALYSSSNDMASWQEEVSAPAYGKIYGATVVVNKSGSTAYMFGGESVDAGGVRTLSGKVYKTTDGTTWSEVAMDSSYTARRKPCVVVDDNNIAWVFGREPVSKGTYCYTAVVSDYAPTFDVWALQLDE